MRVLALNSSPRKDRGGTGRLLTPFLEGMKKAGATVEQVFVHGLDVKPCLGCFHCWTETPGRCIQRDDMDRVVPAMAAADVVVFATPLYVDGMTGTMKLVLDRCIPLVEPAIELRDGHCRHPRRADTKPGKAVLVSVCGFAEVDNFDSLVAHVRALCRNMGRDYAGALLRPYAASLPEIKKAGVPVDDVFLAALKAGRALVETGELPAELLARVSRELVPRAAYLERVNRHFGRAGEAAGAGT